MFMVSVSPYRQSMERATLRASGEASLSALIQAMKKCQSVLNTLTSLHDYREDSAGKKMSMPLVKEHLAAGQKAVIALFEAIEVISR